MKASAPLTGARKRKYDEEQKAKNLKRMMEERERNTPKLGRRDPKHREGLMARRIAGGKLFFGEDFSYDGKIWDPKAGFVKKGGK
jgi:hypothetical protein